MAPLKQHKGLPLLLPVAIILSCCILWPAASTERLATYNHIIHAEVFLSLNGDNITNNSYVDIEDITEDSQLLCGAQIACFNDTNDFFPQAIWLLPNGASITSSQSIQGYHQEYTATNAAILYRSTTSEIPALHGRFCCEIQLDSTQNETLYVNILDIGEVTISLSSSSGKNTELQCSTTIIPPPSDVSPTFEWFFGPNNSSLPSNVTLSDVINNNSTYTSTLQFSLLSQSHAGMYRCTCRIGRNIRLVDEFMLMITVSVFITSYGTNTAGESYSLECSVNVTESNNMEPMITWLNADNFSENVQISPIAKTSNVNNDDIYTRILTINPLIASNNGTYLCQARAGHMIVTREFSLLVNVIHARAIPSDDNRLLTSQQTNFILCCNVSGINNLNSPTITYKWKKDNRTVSDQQNLKFSPFFTSLAGQYNCQATVNSSSLSSAITVTSNNQMVHIQFPDALIVNVSHSMIKIRSTVTLTCTVELSPTVDIPVTVSTKWSGPYGFMTTSTAQPVVGSNTTYTSTAMISSLERNQSGIYNCNASIFSIPPFLIGSIPISGTARVTVGVYLSLKGVPVVYAANSSVFPITEIGNTSNTGLQCITDRMPCCFNMSSRFGEWYFPNKTAVPIQSNAVSFYRNRGDDGRVNLNRLNMDIMMPTGQFCCKVPDALGVSQTVCADIFSVQINVLHEIEDLPTAGNTYTLMCDVSGTNVMSYQWSKDGNIQNETGPTLSFSPLKLSDAGQYSCNILNGTAQHNITVIIPPPSSTIITTDPIVKTIWPVGSNITLICTIEMSPNILDTDLSLLMVSAQLSRDGTPLNQTSQSMSGTTFTYTTQLNSFGRNDSGNYTCSPTLASRQSPYIIESKALSTAVVKVSTGVYLSQNGVVIANYSSIILNDEAQDLLCFTDLNECCTSDTAQFTGNWFFPNRSVIGNQTASSNIYIERGPSVVGLYWNDSVTLPTGVYRCELLDASGITQKVFVGIYGNMMQDSSTSKPDSAEVAGAVVGVLLALVLVIVVSAMFVIFQTRKLNKSVIMKLKPRCGIHFKEDNDYVVHSVAEPHQCNNGQEGHEGEGLELKESDETKADKDKNYYFMDTTLIAGERVKPIPVSEFSSHVERLHADRDKLFEMEYDSVSKHPQSSYSMAEIPYNKLKNRFANILPYDSSRVKLKEIAGEDGSDYINANHLDGYNKPKAYIGAQGPMPNTVGDFWRMIWEKKLPTVVMLTRVFEGKKKCEEYWPVTVGESVQPGHGLTITLTSVLPFAEYSLRKMTLVCSTAPGSAPLKVTQFHFTGWPDHGVPQNGVTLINFIKRVRTAHPYTDSRPLLVHCSAGVGRTGAFIVLDSMLQRMKAEENLNIYEFLKQLRVQRVLMVQTQAQYNFIHDALSELILCGDTEITAPNLRIVISRLNKTKDGESGYNKQFNLITQMSPGYVESDYTQANMECNTSKNRYPNILPNDRHRVMLRAAVGSDYINASFIDGYRQRGAYIATQAPMENTVNDFWRMIWDYQSRAIVMLCKMKDGKEACHTFLPDHKGDSEVYGKIAVKLVSKETTTDYIIQQLEMSEDKPRSQGYTSSGAEQPVVKVGVFHYLRWPKHGIPRGTSALLELMQYINKTQMTSGNKPITVMCNDGVGRTGTFICIHAQLERLKTEGVVDFFQSIKSARIQRAGLVPEVHQYILCHNLVADYLDGFDTYANFKELV